MYKWVFSERLKVSGDEHRRIAPGRVFQARGPATTKARSPSVERRVAGTVKSAEEAERRRRRGSMFSTGRMISCRRYLGADPGGDVANPAYSMGTITLHDATFIEGCFKVLAVWRLRRRC